MTSVKNFEALRQMVVEMQPATNQSRARGLLNQVVTKLPTSKAGRPGIGGGR